MIQLQHRRRLWIRSCGQGVGEPSNSARSCDTSHLKSTQESSPSTGAVAGSSPRAGSNNISFLKHFASGCKIGERAVKSLRGERDGFGQGWMRMNRQADIGRVGTHFDCQRHFGNQIAGAGADNTGAQNSTSLLIKQQFGEAVIAIERQRSSARSPWKCSLAVVDAALPSRRFRSGRPTQFRDPV